MKSKEINELLQHIYESKQENAVISILLSDLISQSDRYFSAFKAANATIERLEKADVDMYCLSLIRDYKEELNNYLTVNQTAD